MFKKNLNAIINGKILKQNLIVTAQNIRNINCSKRALFMNFMDATR